MCHCSRRSHFRLRYLAFSLPLTFANKRAVLRYARSADAMKSIKRILATSLLLCSTSTRASESPPELRVGRAGHAFDHRRRNRRSSRSRRRQRRNDHLRHRPRRPRLPRPAAAKTSSPPSAKPSLNTTATPKQRRHRALDRIPLRHVHREARHVRQKLVRPISAHSSKRRPPNGGSRIKTANPLASWYGGDYNPPA